MKHFKYGSSTAARTNQCQAWQRLSEGVPRTESDAAARGTKIHDALEKAALSETPLVPLATAGLEQDDYELAVEMWETAMAVFDELDIDEFEPEVTGQVSDIIGGTLDLVGRSADGKTVALVDYKTGQGVQVEAENNDQILFAAATAGINSTVADWLQEAEYLVGVIIQPDRGGNVQTKTWKFTPEEAETWWYKHRANIEKAESAKGVQPVAGPACKFCPAEAVCPAKTGQMLRMKQLDPERVEDLVEALNLIEDVKDTIRAVEKMAYEQLEVGVQLPGWKLVRQRSTRSWLDDKAAERALRKLVRGKKIDGVSALKMLKTEPKLVSPAQAEKVLKKVGAPTDVSDLVDNSPSDKFTLAKADDKREAVLSTEAFKAAMDAVA